MAYCHRCNRYFHGEYALAKHKRESNNHWLCDDCGLDFATQHGLNQHFINSPNHPYCRRCDEHFDDDEDLMDHLESFHYYCAKCNKFFTNDYGLREHLRQSSVHHYCAPCKREFKSIQNLNAHLKSSIHQPKTVACPFIGCGGFFVSRSALLLHLEGGNCSSGVDRATVNRLVRRYDKNNIITDPSRLLTNGGKEIRYIAGPSSWNDDVQAYECYLCHGLFRTLTHLNQHLASPRHQAKIYICPLTSCRTHFTTLSGLYQHIESEKCGVSRFKAVQTTMDGLLGKMKRLTV